MKENKFFIFTCFCLFFTSFIYAENVLELDCDNLKLKVFERTGSFCLYQRSTYGKNNYIPLYTDMAYAHTNKFSINLDGKIYRLEKRFGKPIKVEKLDNSCVITFKIKDILHIEQHLSFIPDEYGNTPGPLLKIETIVENTTRRDVNVALRAIFDTSLGEHKSKAALSTDLREAIVSETSFSPKVDKDSVIISSNMEMACMFFFRHGVDVPMQIYIANWERMSPGRWLPKVVEGRSFSSRYLHNDSACMFIWQGKKLSPLEVMSITTTIGAHDFVRAQKDLELKKNTPKDELEKKNSSTKNMTEEQKKNYDYIQELLNKIHALEENPDQMTSGVISDEEIKKLTDETDSAIKYIEEQK